MTLLIIIALQMTHLENKNLNYLNIYIQNENYNRY